MEEVVLKRGAQKNRAKGLSEPPLLTSNDGGVDGMTGRAYENGPASAGRCKKTGFLAIRNEAWLLFSVSYESFCSKSLAIRGHFLIPPHAGGSQAPGGADERSGLSQENGSGARSEGQQ